MDENNTKRNSQVNNYNSKSLINTKLKFYSTTPTMVHLKLTNGQFRNGYIKNQVVPGIWMMDERKLGLVNLFEEEIVTLEDYSKKEEEIK